MRCSAARTSSSTPGMAPGRVARWYEMHLADELGQRPEVDRCVECDRMLEATETFRWVPPLGGVICGRCPGPPAERTGLSLEALKLLKAYQRLDIEAIAALRLPEAVEREVEAAMRDFMRDRPGARPTLARVPRRGPIPPGAPRAGARLTRRMTPVVFDTGSDGDAHALARLATDMIGWLTTVTPEGQPQTFPIWFLWEDGEVLVYSDRRAKRNAEHRDQPAGQPPPQRRRPGRRRRHRRGRGARGRRDAAPDRNPAYLAKYGAWIDEHLSRRRRWRRSTTSRSGSARRAAGPSGHEPARAGRRWPRAAAAVGALRRRARVLDAIVARDGGPDVPAAAGPGARP